MRRLDGTTDSTDMNLGRLWKISWTEEPGSLQSIGPQRVRHDGVTEYTCMGLVALQYVGSSRIKDLTHVFCIGRGILYY